MRFSFFCVLFSLFFSFERIDGVFAVVGDESLLKSEVDQQAYWFASQNNINVFRDSLAFQNLYGAVSKQMIDNLILFDLAKKDTNIVVLDEVVEEQLSLQLNQRIESAGSVSALEKALGEPLSLIRAKLRLEIKKSLQIEYYTSSVVRSISPSFSDVKNFYNTYKDSLPVLEKRIDFSIFEWPVFVSKYKQEDAFLFLSSIKDSVELGGASFNELAKLFSDDVGSAKNGGSLGYTLRGSLVSEYESAAYSLSVGEVSKPFVSPFGCHIVLLEGRVGEKVKTSHILKKLSFDEKDFVLAADSLSLFLDEQLVYKSVNTFDSLCVHYNKKNKVFQGSFINIPISTLPPFLRFLSSNKVGFTDPFVNENKVYVAKINNLFESEKQTLKNSYDNIYSLARSRLIEDSLTDLINKHSETIYIKKYY